MSNLTELRQRAREYSGSYRIIEDGKVPILGKKVAYVRYQNPNNITDNEYIVYKIKNIEESLVLRSRDNSQSCIEWELKNNDDFLNMIQKPL